MNMVMYSGCIVENSEANIYIYFFGHIFAVSGLNRICLNSTLFLLDVAVEEQRL